MNSIAEQLFTRIQNEVGSYQHPQVKAIIAEAVDKLQAERDEFIRRIGANETAQLLMQAVEAQCNATAEAITQRDAALKEADRYALLSAEITMKAAAAMKKPSI